MVAGVSFLAVLEHHFSTVDPGMIGSGAITITCIEHYFSIGKKKERQKERNYICIKYRNYIP